RARHRRVARVRRPAATCRPSAPARSTHAPGRRADDRPRQADVRRWVRSCSCVENTAKSRTTFRCATKRCPRRSREHPISTRVEKMSEANIANTKNDWITPVELTLLGAIWGGSFLFMRVAAPDFGPVALVEVRIVLGALSLMPFLWRARRAIDGALWLRLA